MHAAQLTTEPGMGGRPVSGGCDPITVTDTGGQYYGGLACKALDQGQIRSWPLTS